MRGIVASLLSVATLAWEDRVGWQDHIHSTERYGWTHGDTQTFSDLEWAQAFFDNDDFPQMARFDCYTDGQYLYGFRTTYANDKAAPAHKGVGNDNRWHTTSYVFDEGEYITKLTGRTGYYVDQLQFRTSNGSTFTCGGNGGSSKDTLIPDGCAVVSLGGGMGGNLHNFTADYVCKDELEKKEQQKKWWEEEEEDDKDKKWWEEDDDDWKRKRWGDWNMNKQPQAVLGLRKPQPTMLFPPSIPQALSVVEGFAYRLLLVNDLLEFQRCVDTGAETVQLVQDAFAAMNAGDGMGAMGYAAKAITHAFMGIEDCRDAGNEHEFRAFVLWLDRMTSWDKITEATTEGFHLHAQELEYVTKACKDILFFSGADCTDTTCGFVYDFGYAAGDVAYYALGPIEVRDSILPWAQ